MNARRFILIAIFLAAALVRAADTFRPLDRASWRESDIASIARNFDREGINILYPRIDWRGSGPGFAEMELPLYPWMIAASCRIFGEFETTGRVISLLFSLGTLFLFWLIGREFLGPDAQLFALAFFAFNPLIFESATSLQPEGLTLIAYLAAVYFFARWARTDSRRDLFTAAFLSAIAILAKATAIHVGVLFAFVWLRKEGLRTFRDPRAYAFAAISLVPGILWYAHARSLWLTYGNSLGVSNEYHWIGFDFFTNAYFLKGIFFNEAAFVWVWFGIALGVAGVILKRREPVVPFALCWLSAVFVFLLAAARTTADDWANYYHIFAVAPASLLVGAGAAGGKELIQTKTARLAARSIGVAILLFAIGAFILEARAVRASLIHDRTREPAFAEAKTIRPFLERDGLILVSGGACVDADGYALAYNASYMFYWLDRKGFNICSDRQSIDAVVGFRDQGAEYFVAQKTYLGQAPQLDEKLSSRFRVVAETEDFKVFDLDP